MGFISQLDKETIYELYFKHVSSGKVEFYRTAGIDVIMGRREGVWIWTIDGRKLFDAHCNGGVYNLGHRNPDIIQTLIKALEKLDIGNHHLVSEARALLASRIAELMPEDLNRVTYSVGGGEAVDFAIKLARGYTGRKEIIYAKGGYHGTTGLAVVAGDDYFKKPFEPLAPGFKPVTFGDINELEKVVSKDTAAILLETIPATLGMPLPPEDYYMQIRDLCDKYDCLLILDEIQTGLGRTGKLWGFQHYNVVPDIVTLGKGLSGGIYPIAATVYKDKLEDFMAKHPFIHISTYGGSELGSLVALKVLEISSRQEFLDHVREIGDKLGKILEDLAEKYNDIIDEIRRKGLFIGIKTRSKGLGPLLSIASINNGILAVFANNDKSVLQFLPPLITKNEHLEYLQEHLDNALKFVRENKELSNYIEQLIP